jgi:uncharacterized protein (DUF433 family)
MSRAGTEIAKSRERLHCKADRISMSYYDIITVEPGKRGGHPCIRHMRITVADIRACLLFAADCERRFLSAA